MAKNDAGFSAISSAKRVLRLAATGTLATLAPGGGPFASLVTVATAPGGEPILLLSSLALHTANLAADKRASLLLVAPGGETGDPLAGARLTLTGAAARDDDPILRRRFLARHAEASGYAGFADFAFFRFTIESGHLVAGFGRIVTLPPAELLINVSAAEKLIAHEEGAVGHMNSDHADAIRLYATKLLVLPDGEWRMTGVDPEGADLRAGALRGRLDFPEPVFNPGQLRSVLVTFGQKARSATPRSP